MTGFVPEHRIETARLVLRKPASADIPAIFSRYASDPVVTRYLSWPRHRSIADTEAFLRFSDSEWERWPAGPYLISSRASGALLGSTGLSFESPEIAITGYLLARDAWGQGYATEALRGIVELSGRLGVRRLDALCHPDNAASRRVLEKCGFASEGSVGGQCFPNLGAGGPRDCLRYRLAPGYCA